MGFKTPITIEEVIKDIQANKYVLPAIQREFVWSAAQIEKLFDSLLKGYPIGSFLFWQVQPERLGEFQFYRFMDRYHERDYRHIEPIEVIGDHEVTAVLDGQQRLTALNIGLRGWYADKLRHYHWANDRAFPKRRLYLNLQAPAPPDDMEFAYEFRMLRDKDIQAADGSKFWFPVGKIREFRKVAEVFKYCVEEKLTEGGSTFPSDTLIELWYVIKERPLINYFLEEEQDLDKVLNIFIRVNSGGTQLSYSDMLLSIATAQWKNLDARQEIYGLVDQLNRGEVFSFNKDFVLKASLVLLDIPTIRFHVKNFNRDNMLRIESQWDEISNALRRTAYLLASWGYNRQTLASNNAVLPLAYYLYQKGAPSNFVSSSQFKADRGKMQHWLRVALLKRTFSGQSDNVLRAIRQVVQEHHDTFPREPIFDKLKATPKSMKFDEDELDGLLSYKYGRSYTFTVLALLYPWLDYRQLFHVDHIFPRAMFNKRELERRGIPPEQWPRWLDHVNDLANLQLLQGRENQEKAAQEPEAWLRGECPAPQELASYRERHLIPDVDLSFESFPQFLEAREKLMRERLADLLDVRLGVER